MNYYELGSKDDIIVSNSSLSTINPEEGGNPKKFIDFLEGKKEKELSYYRFGKKLHEYIENEDNFVLEDIDRPSEQMFDLCNLLYNHKLQGNKINPEVAFQLKNENKLMGNIKIFDTFKNKFLQEGLPYLKFLIENGHKNILNASEKDQLKNCAESLKSNTEIYKSLFLSNADEKVHIYNEVSILVEIEVEIIVNNEKILVPLKLKGLIDRLEIGVELQKDFNTIYVKDLKTTGKALSKFKESIISYKYHRQQAFYIFLVQLYMVHGGEARSKDGELINIPKIDINKTRVYSDLIVVEKTGYYNSAVVPLDLDWLTEGTNEYNSLLKRVAWHKHLNIWNQQKEIHTSNGRLIIKI